MPAPKIRLTCCLCHKPIPRSSDVYPLDAEWQRRHPKMVGTLACRCAISSRWQWQCRPAGGPPEGHIPPDHGRGCIDFWSHVGTTCTHTAAVLQFPQTALLQGAQEYLRYTAHGSWASVELADRLQAALAEWEMSTVSTSLSRTP